MALAVCPQYDSEPSISGAFTLSDDKRGSPTPHKWSPNPDENFRAVNFADKHALAEIFPQILDDGTQKQRSLRRRLAKRDVALLIQIGVITTILAINTGLAIFASVRYGSRDGVGLVYHGPCATVKALDLWLHLLINLLSTGMLSASNYCMQLLVAPTRRSVDRAHANGRWLDIGAPSLRNFRYLGAWKRASWLALGLSSVPIHLVYNSAVFTSLPSSEYTIAVVNDAFVEGAGWHLSTAERNQAKDPGWDEDRVNPTSWDHQAIIGGMQREAMAGRYRKLNVSACYDLYDDYWRPQGNGLVFVKNATTPDNRSLQNESLLLYVSVIPRYDDWAKNMWALENGSVTFAAKSPDRGRPDVLISPGRWFLGRARYEVGYCLVQPLEEQVANHCQLEYSLPILSVVCTQNLVKLCVMVTIWAVQRRRQRARAVTRGDSNSDPNETQDDDILCTLGDAVASFIREPDLTTKGMCLANKNDFVRSKRGRKFPLTTQAPQFREWNEERKFWLSAVSPWRVLSVIVGIVFVFLTPTAILLGPAMTSLRLRGFSLYLESLRDLGFGTLSPYTFMTVGLPQSDPGGLIINVLLVNFCQLLLSLLYMVFNATLSAMLVQREFSRMHLDQVKEQRGKRKTLRVSQPLGIQRSSFFLSVPFRYGVPVCASAALFHWLFSCMLFLARIKAVGPDGKVDMEHSFTTAASTVGLALIAAILVLGLRRYDGTMPLVSTNSKAISAACHVLAEDREHGSVLPLQWGVVEIRNGVGRCTFTTAPATEIRKPRAGIRYR